MMTGDEKVKNEFNEEWDAQRDLLFGKEKAAELRKGKNDGRRCSL